MFGTAPTVTTSITIPHIISTGTTPGIAAGAAAGTSPTISVAGTDLAGEIDLTTGTVPPANATLLTLTFNVAYGAAPQCTFSPSNAAAGDLAGLYGVGLVSSSTTTTFVITVTSNNNLPASVQHKWKFVCVQ